MLNTHSSNVPTLLFRGYCGADVGTRFTYRCAPGGMSFTFWNPRIDVPVRNGMFLSVEIMCFLRSRYSAGTLYLTDTFAVPPAYIVYEKPDTPGGTGIDIKS